MNGKVQDRSPLLRYAVLLGVWCFVFLTFVLQWERLPQSLAVHFDFNGRPNGFMSREGNFALVMFLLTVFTVNSLVAREYLRAMRHGAGAGFIAAILDGALVIIAAAHFYILQFNTDKGANFSLWPTLGCVAAAALYGWVVERGAGSGELLKEIAVSPAESGIRMQPGQRFYAEQRGNPRWWNFLCILPIVMLVIELPILSSTGTLSSGIAKTLLFVSAGIQCVLLPFINGFSFIAHPAGIDVRLGVFRIVLKRIPWNAVKSVTVVKNFSALNYFKGFGWRVNPATRLTGYVLSNGEAVRIDTGDWSYLMTMPNAEAFADVARQASEAQP